jgi:hypothetical protein
MAATVLKLVFLFHYCQWITLNTHVGLHHIALYVQVKAVVVLNSFDIYSVSNLVSANLTFLCSSVYILSCGVHNDGK